MKQIALSIAPSGGYKGFGPLGTGSPDQAISTFTYFISSVIGLMTIVAVIWFVFTFFIGAIGIITAGGDKAAVEAARKKITNGIIGLVIVVSAIAIISFVGYLLGFTAVGGILNLNEMFTLIN